MDTTIDALKALYVALGGTAADVGASRVQRCPVSKDPLLLLAGRAGRFSYSDPPPLR